MRRHRLPAPPASAGFTLIEMLVSLLLLAEILVAALVLFDFNNRVARVQTHVADMQQNLRVGQDEVIRYIRQAGRGGLPAQTVSNPADPANVDFLPSGLGVAIRRNADVDADAHILIGDNASAPVVEYTDVLTVRGVFTHPIWFVNYQDPTTLQLNLANANAPTGSIRIDGVTTSGADQDLTALVEACDANRREPLLMASTADDAQYAVVELRSCTVVGAPGDSNYSVTANFLWPGADHNADGDHDDAYINLSPNHDFPSTLTSVITVAILEEYRFFLREEWSNEFNPPDLVPHFARQRVYPNTEEAWNGEAAVDIADNIDDFQVALGIDTNSDGVVSEAAPGATGSEFAADEWLFNREDDDPTDAKWASLGNRLLYIRVNLLARTDRRDKDYVSPPIDRIEDSDWGELASPATETERRDRMFRRRLLTTTIDVRNL